MMERAFEEVGRALKDGDLVAIFPEGRITDTGEMYAFRPGIRRIGLAVGELVPAAGAAPDTLQARVHALRGDWR